MDPDYAEWLAAQQATPAVDPDFAEWQAAQAARKPFVSKLATSFGRGATDVASMLAGVADVITGQAAGRRLGAAITGGPAQEGPMDLAAALKAEYLPKPEASGTLERYALAGAEALPFAALPGGGLVSRVASALGAGFGGQAAKDIGAPEAAGAIIGGLTPAAAAGLARGIGAAGRAIVPDYDLAAKQAANEALNVSGVNRAAAVKALSASSLPANQRVAEITKDPGLISIAKKLEIESPVAKKLGFDLDAAREIARQQKILEAQGTIKLPEQAGRVIRESFEEGLKKAKKVTDAAYDAVKGAPGRVPLTQAKRRIFDIIEDVGGEDAISSSALSRLKGFQKTKASLSVDDFIEEQKKITSELRTYAQIMRTGGGTTPEIANGYRALAGASSAIDDALLKAAEIGKVPKKTAEALKKAKTLRMKQGEMFEAYAVGDVLAKEKFLPKMLPSKVPERLFATPEEARQAFKAIKVSGDASALQDLRSQFFEQLKARAIAPTTGEFTTAGFAREWRKMQNVAKEFLTPQQVKAINQVRGDLLARSRYDRLARSATVGTSPTAEFLGTAGVIKNAMASKATKMLGPIGRILDNLSEGRAQEITKRADEILLRMSFDPAFAKDFLAKPVTSKNVNFVIRGMIARGLIPGLEGEIVAEEPKKKND